ADRLRAIDRGVRGEENGASFALSPERLCVVVLDDLVEGDREATYARLVEFVGASDDERMREFFERDMSPADAHLSRWREGLGRSPPRGDRGGGAAPAGLRRGAPLSGADRRARCGTGDAGRLVPARDVAAGLQSWRARAHGVLRRRARAGGARRGGGSRPYRRAPRRGAPGGADRLLRRRRPAAAPRG